MIVSRKIAGLFKNPGFVNIDYLVENKLERNPSKILNILNRDWRKWVKPLSMFDGGGLDPNFGYETKGMSSTTIASSTAEKICGSVYTMGSETGQQADSITVALKRAAAGSNNVKCAIYLHSDQSLVGSTQQVLTSIGTVAAWYTFNFVAPKPSLTANTDYILVVWADYTTSNISLMFNVWGTDDKGHVQTLAYNSFPNPGTFTHGPFGDEENSIYCTYSTGAPPPKPKGTIAIHTKLAGII